MNGLQRVVRFAPRAIGAIGIVAFLAYGVLSETLVPPGLVPLSGIIISAILILSNLWHLVPDPLRGRYSRVLLALYTGGILFMGLRPKGTYLFAPAGALAFLDPSIPSPYVIAFNVIGFIPLGFLFVVALVQSTRVRRTLVAAAIAVIACALISLGIEVAQHFIVTRMSSLVDYLANTAGGLVGAAYGVLHLNVWRDVDAFADTGA